MTVPKLHRAELTSAQPLAGCTVLLGQVTARSLPARIHDDGNSSLYTGTWLILPTVARRAAWMARTRCEPQEHLVSEQKQSTGQRESLQHCRVIRIAHIGVQRFQSKTKAQIHIPMLMHISHTALLWFISKMSPKCLCWGGGLGKVIGMGGATQPAVLLRAGGLSLVEWPRGVYSHLWLLSSRMPWPERPSFTRPSHHVLESVDHELNPLKLWI